MNISDSQFAQLIGGLFLILVVYIITYSSPLRVVLTTLILISPFEIIETKYGSITVFLIYVMAVVFYMRGAITKAPLWGATLMVLLAYLMSLSQIDHKELVPHAMYIVALASAFLMFYFTYNFVRETGDARPILNVFYIVNVLAIGYTIIQAMAGNEGQVLFSYGVFEINIVPPRVKGGDFRLTGPFGQAPGIFAEYLVISIYLALFEFIHFPSLMKKTFLLCLMAANIAALIATANRGGILILVGVFPIFLYLFREILGVIKTVRILVLSGVMVTVAAMYVINYSTFNLAFDRMAATKIEAGVPDTREKTWSATIARIPDNIFLGHGPLLQPSDQQLVSNAGLYDYPHNLYLYLLFTVGTVGLLAILNFLACIFYRLASVPQQPPGDYAAGLARLGGLIIVIVLIDQIKIEFLRFAATDYWFYLFALLGVLLAVADDLRTRHFHPSQRPG